MTLPSFSQDGRVALVTGGRRGIGRATALAFAEAGADVAICDVAADDGLLDATAAEIRGFGRRALALPADVTSEAEVNAMVDRTRSELGRIDVLVNNAGIAGVEPALTDFGEDGNFYAVYDVTVKGTCLCTAAVAPTMIDQGGGCIVNLSSMDAFLNRGAGAYSLAKRAIIDITMAAATDYGPHGVRVNAIAPRVIMTDMTAGMRALPGSGVLREDDASRAPRRAGRYRPRRAAARLGRRPLHDRPDPPGRRRPHSRGPAQPARARRLRLLRGLGCDHETQDRQLTSTQPP